MVDREKPFIYTCYTCNVNFEAKQCPKCGKKGTPIYKNQSIERPKNNPTDVNAFFERKRKA